MIMNKIWDNNTNVKMNKLVKKLTLEDKEHTNANTIKEVCEHTEQYEHNHGSKKNIQNKDTR